MTMKRREFLLVSGSAVAAAAMGACTKSRRLHGRVVSLRDPMAARVTRHEFPGAVWLVAQGDDMAVDAVGVTAIDGSAPMRRDTIFRIASMTKAVTASAVMMLVEDGTLTLDAPAERWLPEIANRRVLRRIEGPLTDTVPARGAIPVRDLLSFTLGFGLFFDTALPIRRAIDENHLVNGPPVPMTPHGPGEWMKRFGTLPRVHQPGERWLHHTGSPPQRSVVRRSPA